MKGAQWIAIIAAIVLAAVLSFTGFNRKRAIIPENGPEMAASEGEHEHEHEGDAIAGGVELFKALGLGAEWEELSTKEGKGRAELAAQLMSRINAQTAPYAVLLIESNSQDNQDAEQVFEAGKILVDSALSTTRKESVKEFYAMYAEKAFQLSSSAMPERTDVKNALATSRIYLSGDVMGGVQLFLEVIKEDPNNEAALYNLGMLAIQSGQMDKAEKRFEKLVSLQPENETYARILEDIRSGATQ